MKKSISRIIGLIMLIIAIVYNQYGCRCLCCSGTYCILRKYYLYRVSFKSINQIKKSEAFQSVHHVSFILCYTVLYDFVALAFSLTRVRKHWWEDITQGNI